VAWSWNVAIGGATTIAVARLLSAFMPRDVEAAA